MPEPKEAPLTNKDWAVRLQAVEWRSLGAYISWRLAEIHSKLETGSDEEVKVLQGRARELRALLEVQRLGQVIQTTTDQDRGNLYG